ncbi:uncharacterized protein LOC110267485 [Arachis ipaensis]|uniref:uncharacterized protein LOC110267485 n=1 Tax=Arachis ipaensis TaxID=130454 RepID=UPI000A2B16C4|nr:uncharacterized protein LOC110267485 [Arachis ipaensis]
MEDVTVSRDCHYFVWVDEIDGGWQSLARCLIRRLNELECDVANQDVTIVPTNHRERNVNMATKVEKKIEDEIKAMRVWLVSVSWEVVLLTHTQTAPLRSVLFHCFVKLCHICMAQYLCCAPGITSSRAGIRP